MSGLLSFFNVCKGKSSFSIQHSSFVTLRSSFHHAAVLYPCRPDQAISRCPHRRRIPSPLSCVATYDRRSPYLVRRARQRPPWHHHLSFCHEGRDLPHRVLVP